MPINENLMKTFSLSSAQKAYLMLGGHWIEIIHVTFKWNTLCPYII